MIKAIIIIGKTFSKGQKITLSEILTSIYKDLNMRVPVSAYPSTQPREEIIERERRERRRERETKSADSVEVIIGRPWQIRNDFLYIMKAIKLSTFTTYSGSNGKNFTSPSNERTNNAAYHHRHHHLTRQRMQQRERAVAAAAETAVFLYF